MGLFLWVNFTIVQPVKFQVVDSSRGFAGLKREQVKRWDYFSLSSAIRIENPDAFFASYIAASAFFTSVFSS